MSKRQWKCPECGGTTLMYDGRDALSQYWMCESADNNLCLSRFGKKTIVALVNSGSAPVGVQAKTFTVSPPGFEMPWELKGGPSRTPQEAFHNTLPENFRPDFTNNGSKCECGADKANTTHSTWCQAWKGYKKGDF